MMQFNYGRLQYRLILMYSVEGSNAEPPINLKSDHGSVLHQLPLITQFEDEESEQKGCKYFHLPISKFFPQTDSWTCLESCKFERALVPEAAVVIEPSFGLIVLCILTPYPCHPPHSVRLIGHHVAFLHIEPIWHCVVG